MMEDCNMKRKQYIKPCLWQQVVIPCNVLCESLEQGDGPGNLVPEGRRLLRGNEETQGWTRTSRSAWDEVW